MEQMNVFLLLLFESGFWGRRLMHAGLGFQGGKMVLKAAESYLGVSPSCV